MNRSVRAALTAVLTVILAVSAGMAVHIQQEDRERTASYEAAAQCAQLSLPEPADQSAGWDRGPVPMPDDILDLEALQEVNPDVLGWIWIPGTELSYPLLQGEDNDFYLEYTWDRNPNVGGSIYMDHRCAPDLTSDNTIIYGHRMRNGSMFAALKYYKDQDFWQEHPTVYIADRSGVHVYDIFAAWEASISSFTYATDLDTEDRREKFLSTCLEGSELETGIVPGRDDPILTLSTCTGRGHSTRWVVQGCLVWESGDHAE